MRRVDKSARSAIEGYKSYTDMDICTVKDCKNEVRYEGSFVCREHVAKYDKKKNDDKPWIEGIPRIIKERKEKFKSKWKMENQ